VSPELLRTLGVGAFQVVLLPVLFISNRLRRLTPVPRRPALVRSIEPDIDSLLAVGKSPTSRLKSRIAIENAH
jgi:hypothetical protein